MEQVKEYDSSKSLWKSEMLPITSHLHIGPFSNNAQVLSVLFSIKPRIDHVGSSFKTCRFMELVENFKISTYTLQECCSVSELHQHIQGTLN